MTTLDARNLTLNEVCGFLNFEQHLSGAIASLLSLEPLTDFEHQELLEIRNLFWNYYSQGKISEGQVKFLILAPLMRLSGFYNPNIKITLEENIADILIEDEDTIIKGRMDILAVSKIQEKTAVTPFWVLVIESKNSSIEALEGLPQLLAYAYKSLEHQESIWGLTTNGIRYQFVYLQQGNPLTYKLFPDMSLIYPEGAIELLQVMKAICQLHY
jgi:hypothetical protein